MPEEFSAMGGYIKIFGAIALVFGCSYGYRFLAMKKIKDTTAGASKMMVDAGYRLFGLESTYLQDHIDALTKSTSLWKQQEYTLVRDFLGHDVFFHYHYKELSQQPNDNDISLDTETKWSMNLEKDLAGQFQIAEKKKHKLGLPTSWQPAEPAIKTGDTQFDNKFRFFGDIDLIKRMLSSPDVRQALLQIHAVHLEVGPTSLTFWEQDRANTTNLSGGRIGQLSMGANLEKHTAIALPFHEQVAELLLHIKRAV